MRKPSYNLQEVEMADLKNLQNALNNDAALRSKFVNDPGKVLTDHNVHLDPHTLKSLEDQIKAKNLAGGGNPNAISVGVTVGT
jgi:hypothetical protein